MAGHGNPSEWSEAAILRIIRDRSHTGRCTAGDISRITGVTREATWWRLRKMRDEGKVTWEAGVKGSLRLTEEAR